DILSDVSWDLVDQALAELQRKTSKQDDAVAAFRPKVDAWSAPLDRLESEFSGTTGRGPVLTRLDREELVRLRDLVKRVSKPLDAGQFSAAIDSARTVEAELSDLDAKLDHLRERALRS